MYYPATKAKGHLWMTSDPFPFAELLASHYGLKVVAAVPLKSVWGVIAEDNTRWIWKTTVGRDSEVRCRALHRVTEELHQYGIDFAGPVPSNAGTFLVPISLTDPALKGVNQLGYLQPWLTGRHVNLQQDAERETVVATIARMHQASRNLILNGAEQRSLDTGLLLHRFLRKQTALEHVWPHAVRRFHDLEQIEAQVWSSVRNSVNALSHWQPQTPRCFCHRDLAAHNILWDNNREGKVAFVDTDQSGLDLPLLDILQLCNHGLYFANPAQDYFVRILSAYEAKSTLATSDQQLLWTLFSFPDLLIRTLVEWVRAGSPSRGRWKVLLSVQKELQRWAILGETGRQTRPDVQ